MGACNSPWSALRVVGRRQGQPRTFAEYRIQLQGLIARRGPPGPESGEVQLFVIGDHAADVKELLDPPTAAFAHRPSQLGGTTNTVDGFAQFSRRLRGDEEPVIF